MKINNRNHEHKQNSTLTLRLHLQEIQLNKNTSQSPNNNRKYNYNLCSVDAHSRIVNLPKLTNRFTTRQYKINQPDTNISHIGIDYSNCIPPPHNHKYNPNHTQIQQNTPHPQPYPPKTNKQQYIQRIRQIRNEGQQLQKSTTTILSKAHKVGKVLGKKYKKLRECSNSILTGMQEYCLEEQKNRIYKHEIRQMWMRYHK